jgi:hypothetical protein
VEQDAITQALGYTAEYKEKSAEDLENLFFDQGTKAGSSGLLVKAGSLDDAKKRLAEHLEAEAEVNEAQVVIIFGEQFSANALAICDYLNGVLQPDLCSFECGGTRSIRIPENTSSRSSNCCPRRAHVR